MKLKKLIVALCFLTIGDSYATDQNINSENKDQVTYENSIQTYLKNTNDALESGNEFKIKDMLDKRASFVDQLTKNNLATNWTCSNVQRVQKINSNNQKECRNSKESILAIVTCSGVLEKSRTTISLNRGDKLRLCVSHSDIQLGKVSIAQHQGLKFNGTVILADTDKDWFLQSSPRIISSRMGSPTTSVMEYGAIEFTLPLEDVHITGTFDLPISNECLKINKGEGC